MKKDTKKDKYDRVFGWTLFVLFITFLTLYISQAAGYYSYAQSKKTAFTEEQIKKFEQDVKDGKEIDITEYLANTNKDYQNNVSKVGLRISEGISKYTKLGIEKLFSGIASIIGE